MLNGIALIAAAGVCWLSYLIGYRGGLADGIRRAQRRQRVKDQLARTMRSPW